MPPIRPTLPALACVALLVACSGDAGPVSPMTSRVAAPAAGPTVTVFAQNVYVGTNVDAVLGAPADQLPAAVGHALMTFLATDWPARADAIAARIVASGAEAVALNELTILTVTNLAPLLPDLHVDFLPILMARIAAQGGNYVVGAQVANTDAILSFGPGQIRLQDFDAVLVRADVPFTPVASTQFAARAPVSLGPLGSFDLIRGYAAVELSIHGTPVRVVATHLEPLETAAVLQAAQAQELIGWLDAQQVRTIVAGDLNSSPTHVDPGSPYRQFRAAGFRDAWLDRTGPKADPGYTCCHADDLLNPVSSLVKRIDHVLVRSPHPGAGATSVTLFGADPMDRTPGGRWPSDHAGILATVTFPGIRGSGAP